MPWTHDLAPSRWRARAALGLTALLALGGCAESARFSVSEGTGPTPRLPAPNKTLIPTVNVAPAVGWPSGAAPTPAAGTRVTA
ncbi:MAG: sorbosone dehydrogenase family protein, partial [Hydrogenophaga sp.]|nr:sorbosone dehydrogenase family protein [Hydrogenophaga sp.]